MTVPEQPKRLSADDLANVTRFRFREEVLEVPELGGEIVLKSLSVREREMLPEPDDMAETDDKGVRTDKALRTAGEVFSVIVKEPSVTPEQATEFLGTWPTEAFDRVTGAFARMVGSEEEEKAAAAEFPAG